MKKRILAWAFTALAVTVASVSIAGTATASEADVANQKLEQRLPAALSATRAAAPAVSGATVSRRRIRKMPTYVARYNSSEVARYVYEDPEFSWTEYGVRSCRRISRQRVDCYTFVAEDVYDDYGYYLDTILCDWFTASAYLRNGRLKLWSYSQECVLLSEV